jgi:hypothetical protein
MLRKPGQLLLTGNDDAVVPYPQFDPDALADRVCPIAPSPSETGNLGNSFLSLDVLGLWS